MNKTAQKAEKRAVRHRRLRAKISGTAERPRLAVFRSNKDVYAQLIDDVAGKTLAAVDSRKQTGATLTERARATGAALAKAAKDAKIDAVVFDRGGYRYTGVVAALAEGVRDGGITV